MANTREKILRSLTPTPQSDSKNESNVNIELKNKDLQLYTKYIDDKLDKLTATLECSLINKICDVITNKVTLELNSLKEKFVMFDEIKSSLDFLSNEYDRLQKESKVNSATINKLCIDNQRLQTNNDILMKKVDILDQFNRKNNVEIQMVPERSNENPVILFNKLCSAVSFPIRTEEILACHRVPQSNKNSGRPKNIIVELPSTHTRDALLSAVKNHNKMNPSTKLNSGHLDIPGKTPIYVSEQLTPNNKELFATVRHAAKEKNIKFVWIRNGKVYVRKNENSPAVWVSSKDMLENI